MFSFLSWLWNFPFSNLNKFLLIKFLLLILSIFVFLLRDEVHNLKDEKDLSTSPEEQGTANTLLAILNNSGYSSFLNFQNFKTLSEYEKVL